MNFLEVPPTCGVNHSATNRVIRSHIKPEPGTPALMLYPDFGNFKGKLEQESQVGLVALPETKNELRLELLSISTSRQKGH